MHILISIPITHRSSQASALAPDAAAAEEGDNEHEYTQHEHANGYSVGIGQCLDTLELINVREHYGAQHDEQNAHDL